MSRPHSTYHSHPWGSSNEQKAQSHHNPPHFTHSAYAASAGPSTYRALSSGHVAPAPVGQHTHHSDPWAHRPNAAGPSTSPLPPNFASPGSGSSNSPTDQPIVRTTHITEDGTTIYAATGRKRKRLQKACVACHKAKRRCDGGLPCSNCDFSGRTCCYSDANGKMVVPTARVAGETSAQPAGAPANHQAVTSHSPEGFTPTYHAVASATSPSAGSDFPSRARGNTITKPVGTAAMRADGLLTIDDVAPERRRELISIFFSQIHPFSCVMDEISFLRDLSTSEVPAWLLMAMFALSARFEQGISEAERERRFSHGECFARTARQMLQQEDQEGFTLLDRPDVDLALTLCLLAAHELGMGRLQRALSYSNDAVRIVATLKLADGHIPPARKATYARDSFASSSSPRRATCERLVLLTWILDMTISALSAQISAVRRSDVLAAVRNFGTSGDEVRDNVTKSFARLVEVATVFRLVVDINEPCSKGEEALQSWAANLVVEHKFDDYNMKQASRLLEEPEASAAAHRAWFWAQMHLIAECSVFVMETRRVGGSQTDRGQQQAALDNIHLILSVLSITGRRNFFAFPALLICTQYSRPNPDMARWWATARQCWSLTDHQITEAAQFFVRSRNEDTSPGRDNNGTATHLESLTLPRLSNSSAGSASASLPSIAKLPLPALRLSPPLSARIRSAETSPTAPVWRSASSGAEERRNRSPRSSIGGKSETNDDAMSDSSRDSSAMSPRSAPTEFGSDEYVPVIAQRGSRSPPLASHSFAKNPLSSWSPISSLRGEKRTISAIST